MYVYFLCVLYMQLRSLSLSFQMEAVYFLAGEIVQIITLLFCTKALLLKNGKLIRRMFTYASTRALKVKYKSFCFAPTTVQYIDRSYFFVCSSFIQYCSVYCDFVIFSDGVQTYYAIQKIPRDCVIFEEPRK